MAGGVAAPVVSAQQAPSAPSAPMAQSPMVQQMQSQASMQSPYAGLPMAQSAQYGMPQQMGGIQSLLAGLMNRYQQPQMQARYSPMPQYNAPGAYYRPNMGMAQQNLSRTATTQAKALADAAARKVALEQQAADDADFLNWQRQQYSAYKSARDNPYSGG